MADCKKHRIKVLNPDVNESDSNFTVNKNGDIRFGMGGMKGFGDNLVAAIVNERDAHGQFPDIYDFCERMSGTLNHKAMESLVYSGAFDSFGIERGRYFLPGGSGDLFLDELINYGLNTRQNAEDAGASLFGDVEELKVQKPEPPVPVAEPDILEYLQHEKDVVGMYLSDHPLKRYEFEMDTFASCRLADIDDLVSGCEKHRKGMKVTVAGFINSVEIKTSKAGKPWARAVLEDFSGTRAFSFFGKDYESFMEYLKDHTAVFIEGEIKESYPVRPEERKPGETIPYKFKIKKINLLGNISDAMLSAFTVEVDAGSLTPDFRKRLAAAIKGSKGNIPVNMIVMDPDTGYNVEFVSRKYHVAVTADFISGIRELGLKYRVARKTTA